jgi:hypothetical protein
MATNRAVQQVIDLQNRITGLSAQGRLDELTHGEVALISYALGRYHAELLQTDPEEELKALATMRRAAKKAGVKA